MITSLIIANAATFPRETPVKIGPLKPLNYLFGGNATGKTTISRVIERPEADEFSDCTVVWEHGTELRALVYNCDFIRQNFMEDRDVPGIFTLGSDNVALLEEIRKTQEELTAITDKLTSRRTALGGDEGTSGKKAEERRCFEQFKKACWRQKTELEGEFKPAFAGLLGSRSLFARRVISEHDRVKSAGTQAPDLEPLRRLAEELFGNKLAKEALLERLDATRLVRLQEHAILSTRVVGKEDVDLASLIKKLGNSDWVRDGRPYLARADGLCPFCQQEAPATLEQQLGEFFDDTYTAQAAEIDKLADEYSVAAGELRRAGEAPVDSGHRYVDLDRLKVAVSALNRTLDRNIGKIGQKRSEPSQVIALDDVQGVVDDVSAIIHEANEEVRKQHRRVHDLEGERTRLIEKVWHYLVEEIGRDITQYRTDGANIAKAIKSLEGQITEIEGQQKDKERALKGLEQRTTSTTPTVDQINKLLQSYGFHSFRLASAADGTAYRLVRPDGTTDAARSLSEGERTFIAFLYFYHLVDGGHGSASGVTDRRIVVIDDPVSSLDSDILFIVSTLVRELAEKIRSGDGVVRQLILLTHNVYFHWEVTYNYKNRGDITYWTVRKAQERTTVDQHHENPVSTTYKMLWDEMKRVRGLDHPPPTVGNVMRRILEYYFRILGDTRLADIPSAFEGKEQMICKSLISWTHAGSHACFDDAFHIVSPADVAKHVEVFKAVFDKIGHIAHYDMMMGE